MERYRYKAWEYRNYKVRCGGDCDRCARRSACPVDEERLKMWEDCGMVCQSWLPDGPVTDFQI